jgi:hypothetical protein
LRDLRRPLEPLCPSRPGLMAPTLSVMPYTGQPNRSQTAVHHASQMAARRRRTTYLRPPIPPYYRQLLETAERYRQHDEHDVAVILAQTSCELVTEAAFETLIRPHGLTQKEKEQLLPRNYDLNNERVSASTSCSRRTNQGPAFLGGLHRPCEAPPRNCPQGKAGDGAAGRGLPSCCHRPHRARRGSHCPCERNPSARVGIRVNRPSPLDSPLESGVAMRDKTKLGLRSPR